MSAEEAIEAARGRPEPTEKTPLVSGGSTRHCFLDTAVRVRLLTAVASLAEGYDLGVINGAVVLMREDLGLTPEQVGIAVAVFFFVAAPAVLVAGSVADTIGRKGAVGVSSVCLAVGNLIWAFSFNFSTLLLGRALLGAGVGSGIATVTIYISEVAPKEKRGFYSALEPFFLNVGIPLGFASGALLVGLPHAWRIMVGIGAVPAVLVAISVLTPFFPESPRYLAAMGLFSEAEEVLSDLLHAAGAADADAEAAAVIEAWKNHDIDDGTSGWVEALSSFVGARKRMAVAGVGVGLAQMLSGISVFTAFSTLVLTQNGMSTKGAINTTVGIGIIKMATIILSAFVLLDRWGRRPLLIMSAAIMAAASFLISTACFLSMGPPFVATGLLLFAVGFSMGLGPATYVYIAEVFDTRVRGKGVAAAAFTGRIANGLYSLFVPVAVISMGVRGIFLLIGVLNLIVLAYCYALCPETKGVCLEKVQTVFHCEDAVKAHSQGAAKDA